MSTMVVTTRITHRYLMGKTKWDLSQMIMMLLDDVDRLTAEAEHLKKEGWFNAALTSKRHAPQQQGMVSMCAS